LADNATSKGAGLLLPFSSEAVICCSKLMTGWLSEPAAEQPEREGAGLAADTGGAGPGVGGGTSHRDHDQTAHRRLGFEV
jgi:hypothetical protein